MIEQQLTEIFAREQPTLFLPIGLPCSGKTLLQKYVESISYHPITVLSSDALIEQMAEKKGISYQEAYGLADHEAIKQQLNDTAIEAAATGQHIFWDRTNLTQEERAERRALAPNHLAVGILITAPLDEIKDACIIREEEIGKAIPEFVLDNQASAIRSPIPQAAEFDTMIYTRRAEIIETLTL